MLQALWSQARLGLPITTIICSNRRYRILELEQQRAGIRPGPIAADLTRLDDPALDWVGIARAMGVTGEVVHDQPGLDRALQRGLQVDGPYLIEARI
jgi:acetolactate synthase-1/2/3 large subunit